MYELNTELKQFQKKTVKWMLDHESKYDGGLLLNEAGLGKSICVVSTIINSPVKTLIICPAGLIDNWINEIKIHSNIQMEQIVKYYGTGRHDTKDDTKKETKEETKEDTKEDKAENTKKDKIIYVTSYSIISREFMGKDFIKKSIFNKIKFGRIVLDEAHYIRNTYSEVNKSVTFLGGLYGINIKKWVVTATPIFNSQNDMFSYFRFLGLEGVDTKSDWNRMISKSLDGFETLNNWIDKYGISMKKAMVLKELTDKTENVMELNFTSLESEFYNALKDYSQIRMKTIIKRINNLNRKVFDDVNGSMRKILHNNVMVYILRLKQACNSPWLIFERMNRLKDINSIEDAIVKLQYYNSSLNMEEECPICYDTTANYIANPCGHKCCEQCWNKMFNVGIVNCPKCREYVEEIKCIKAIEDKAIEDNAIEDKAIEDNAIKDEIDIKNTAKISKIVDITLDVIKKNEKIIIVSQWVSMLNIIRRVFDKHPTLSKMKYISLQGDMPLKNRTVAIKEFESNENVQICFVSLMSSAEGINLVSANHLILVDSWWNNSKMSQVMDRIHRIGQKKAVHIYKFQIKSSIEEQIAQLVKKKEKITNLVLHKWMIKDKSSYDASWMTNIIKLIDKPSEN